MEINRSLGVPLQAMRKTVEGKQLHHPILWDDACQNTRAYGIEAWPFVYLIGPDGKVFWEGNPSRWLGRPKKAKEMRALIERKLAEATRFPTELARADP